MTAELTLSDEGFVVLDHHEGDVLRAYLCPASKWTISRGLTAASGVITPRAGMVITPSESDRLTRLALRRNYEPRVRKNMLLNGIAHLQAAFDGGVLFDFNTGRIHNATWVKLFNNRVMAQARASFLTWIRGGGRVLPGLQRRRGDEAGMIFDGVYPAASKAAKAKPTTQWAAWVIAIDDDTKAAVREVLAAQGYAVGTDPARISAAAVRAYQEKHGLTVDAKIGRATLSSLQRELDARTAAKRAGGTAAGGGITAGGAETTPEPAFDATFFTYAGLGLLAIGGVWLLWRAYTHRDVIAAALHDRLPRVARWLRSF